jgi:uncharacterized repeat protein (TIGR03803 family)
MHSRFLSAFHVFSVLLALAYAAQAQTFQVLHTFEGTDGSSPGALVVDSSGNLYGTASRGAIDNCNTFGCGTVFELSPTQSGWSFATLYKFQSKTDGYYPAAPLTLGPGGIFYGATVDGGLEGGGGTVFRIVPTCTDPGCKQKLWSKTTLHRFGRCDGAGTNGGMVLDKAGNLYGTTIAACSRNGQIYELSPSQQLQGNWKESVIHAFAGAPSDGEWILNTLLIDGTGNLYGTTFSGGASNVGTIYRLSPQGSAWHEDLLYAFSGLDIIHPVNSVISDSAGSLYGVTYGDQQPSIAFKLTNSEGSWVFTTLYTFLPGQAEELTSGLVMDAAGNLYGAGIGGAYGNGAVYKLSQTPNGWIYSSLHDFSGGGDGASPSGPLTLDANGNLYGSASAGGDLNCNTGGGCGTVWVIKPQ